MTQWLQSGRRRDVCVLLCGERLRGQELKSRLESHYDTRIKPQGFYGALDALVSKGYVIEETEGIHDVYALTEAGERRLREHYDWMGEHLESG